MDRRRFLGAALGGCGALLLGSSASASAARSKVEAVHRAASGTTFRLALDHAPFPYAGAPWLDPTVMVFVPSAYRAPDDGSLDVVVHFHGHNTTAERTMIAHQLREQLVDSKQNAILIVPQGAVMAPESGLGKLATKGGLRRMLAETARVLRTRDAEEVLGASMAPRDARLGMVCLSAHSGGYTSVASCLVRGGVQVREVYLFDALYGEVDAYREWVRAARDASGRDRHKLVSYYAGERVRANNLQLLASLEADGIECLHERTPGELSRDQMVRGRVIFLRSTLMHGQVPHELNGLRDCLFASCLSRRLSTRWFAHRSEPRPLEPRGGCSGSACGRPR